MKTHKPQVCPVCLGSVLDACRSVYCSAKCRKRSRRLAYRANRLARGLSGTARPPRADHDDPDCRGTTRCWCWHKARWGELFDEQKDKGAVLP